MVQVVSYGFITHRMIAGHFDENCLPANKNIKYKVESINKGIYREQNMPMTISGMMGDLTVLLQRIADTHLNENESQNLVCVLKKRRANNKDSHILGRIVKQRTF